MKLYKIQAGKAYFSKKHDTMLINDKYFAGLNYLQQKIIFIHEFAHRYTSQEAKADFIAFAFCCKTDTPEAVTTAFFQLTQDTERRALILNNYIKFKKNEYTNQRAL